jgi:hypothetical protein
MTYKEKARNIRTQIQAMRIYRRGTILPFLTLRLFARRRPGVDFTASWGFALQRRESRNGPFV